MKTDPSNKLSLPVSFAAALVCVLLALWMPSLAESAPSDYKSRSAVGTSPSSSGYNLLELTDEIVGQTRSGLPDLRVYYGEEEIPYGLVTDEELLRPARYEKADIFNRGIDQAGNVVFELTIPPDKIARTINFLSGDKNFIRSVQVEGSRDGQEWVMLAAGRTIYDLTDEHKTRRSEVNLGLTHFRYLRITVHNEGKGKFTLSGVEIAYTSPAGAALETKERPYATLAAVTKDGVQEYTMDLFQPHLPTRELEIITKEENFNRLVEVYSSEDNKDWRLVATGEVYSYRLDKLTARQGSIKFRTDTRYLKVRVHDRDNLPLKIEAMKLRGINPAVVLPAGEGKELFVYWNSHVKAPVYDIQKFKGSMDYSVMPRATLAKAEGNKAFRDSRPWSERNPWLLQVMLGFVAVILLVVIAQSIRKISSDKGKE